MVYNWTRGIEFEHGSSLNSLVSSIFINFEKKRKIYVYYTTETIEKQNDYFFMYGYKPSLHPNTALCSYTPIRGAMSFDVVNDKAISFIQISQLDIYNINT